jgi:hypothetical protein
MMITIADLVRYRLNSETKAALQPVIGALVSGSGKRRNASAARGYP